MGAERSHSAPLTTASAGLIHSKVSERDNNAAVSANKALRGEAPDGERELAAQRGGVRAFVSLAGAGRPFDEVLTEQMGRAVRSGQLPQKALTAMQGALAELPAGRPVQTRPPNIPRKLWNGLFQPRAQEYLLSLFRYDPVAELAKLPPKGVTSAPAGL